MTILNQITNNTFEQAISFSRHVQRILFSDPSQKEILLKNWGRPYQKPEMLDFLNDNMQSGNDEAELNCVLRKLRKQVMLRLTVRDISGCADLTEVMSTMSDLAEICVNFSLEHHEKWLTQPERFGMPISKKNGNAQYLWVGRARIKCFFRH